MSYMVEYEDDDGKIQYREFDSINRARGYARRLSAKNHSWMVYVVALDDREGGRVGAEAYAYGRRDHTEGRMAA